MSDEDHTFQPVGDEPTGDPVQHLLYSWSSRESSLRLAGSWLAVAVFAMVAAIGVFTALDQVGELGHYVQDIGFISGLDREFGTMMIATGTGMVGALVPSVILRRQGPGRTSRSVVALLVLVFSLAGVFVLATAAIGGLGALPGVFLMAFAGYPVALAPASIGVAIFLLLTSGALLWAGAHVVPARRNHLAIAFHVGFVASFSAFLLFYQLRQPDIGALQGLEPPMGFVHGMVLTSTVWGALLSSYLVLQVPDWFERSLEKRWNRIGRDLASCLLLLNGFGLAAATTVHYVLLPLQGG